MKEELQSKLIEVIDAIQATAGKAGEFALTQLPDIAQQYVAYGRVTSAVIAIALLLAATVLLGMGYWAYKNPWNTSSYSWERDARRSDSNYLVMVIGGVGGGLALFIAVASFNYLVWLAPKVWLIKELASLIK